MRLFLLPALLFVFLASSATGDEKTDADLKAMVGKWKVEKAELSGKDITEQLKELKLEILAGAKYSVVFGKETDDGALAIDPAKTPKTMDAKGNGGPNKGKTVKAIYKLDGDTLTVCYDHNADAAKYPAKFETKEGTTLLLVVYKRKK